MTPPSLRAWAVGAMLALGVFLWLTIGRALVDWNEQLPVAVGVVAAVVLVAIPPIRRVGTEILERIEAPSPRRRAFAAWVVAAAATAYFILTAHLQGRYFGPVWHDEQSYLTHAHMLARGRLWMPPHELADFFDSFYIIHRPVYAAMYFPGTSLLYLPTAWFGLPSWLMPVLAAGGVVGLAYRVVTELADGVAGALAALMLICLQSLRLLSLLFMSQVPVTLLGLLMVWGYLRWRKSRRAGWALTIGALAGWAAITRPVDSLCFSIPVGLAILADLWQRDAETRAASSRVRTILLIAAGAAPFLVLQVVANRGITGSWLTTPWTHYVQRDFPQTQMGFRVLDPSVRPASPSPHKRVFYDQQVPGLLREHSVAAAPRAWWRHRLPTTLAGTLPHASLVVLLPAGILACHRRRWVLAAALLLFIAAYVPSVFFTRYYPVVAAPAAALLVALGAGAVADMFPRRRDAIRLLVVLAVAAVAACMLPEARRTSADQPFEPRLTRLLDRALHHVTPPAIVLVRFSPDRNLNEQSVTNPRAAWPDDAPVICAHDLGPENHRLFRYYAQRQPNRNVYHFDERDGSIQRLGTVAELAGRSGPP